MSAARCSTALTQKAQHIGSRRAPWLVLAINAVGLLVGFVAGCTMGSTGLQADAVDLPADARNDAIRPTRLTLALRCRAWPSFAKGA